ncbi:MAG: tetratricopeptide repeat protein [Acidimicrobiales bacterium]
MDEALEIARGTGDQRTIAAVLSEFHRALHGPNAMPEAIAMADELESLAASLADDDIAFQALNLRLLATAALGQWERAQRTATQLAAMAERLRHIEGRRISLSWFVCAAFAQGRFDEAHQLIRELKVLLVNYPAADFEAMMGVLQFVEPWLGGHSALLRTLSERSRSGTTISPVWFAAEAGQLDDVNGLLAALPPTADNNRRFDYLWWNDIVGRTRIALRTGDRALASDLLDMLIPFADGHAQMGAVCFLGTGHFHLGTLHYVLGDFDAAIASYERAIELHQAMQARPWVAFAQAELAVALEARDAPGDVARANELRDASRAVAEELKLGLILETLDRPGGVLPDD